MSTRRRIGVSAATTEAARRHLMAKVPCWEKIWIVPDNAPQGSTLKAFKWVKTEKTQQFSDDEDEVDEPLAPIPDEEPEVVEEVGEGDEEDEPAAPFGPEASVNSLDVPKESDDILSKPPSPKAHPLSISFQPASEPSMETGDVLDVSLKLLDSSMESVVVDGTENVTAEDVDALDISVLGTDGTAFDAAHDLSQMDGGDDLMGGPLMNNSVNPFGGPLEE